MTKEKKALALIELIARKYPPEMFVCDDDGWANCMFCFADRDEKHSPDCIAVMIQELAKHP